MSSANPYGTSDAFVKIPVRGDRYKILDNNKDAKTIGVVVEVVSENGMNTVRVYEESREDGVVLDNQLKEYSLFEMSEYIGPSSPEELLTSKIDALREFATVLIKEREVAQKQKPVLRDNCSDEEFDAFLNNIISSKDE